MNKGGKIAALFFLAGTIGLFGGTTLNAVYNVNKRNVLINEKEIFLENYFNDKAEEKTAYLVKENVDVISDAEIKNKVEQQNEKIEEAKNSADGAVMTTVMAGVIMAGAGAMVAELNNRESKIGLDQQPEMNQ